MGCWFSKPSVKALLKKATDSQKAFEAAAPGSKDAQTALEQAMSEYSEVYDLARERRHDLDMAIAINYATFLDNYKKTSGKNAEKTAIYVLSETQAIFTAQEKKPPQYPLLLNNLADALLNQYLDPDDRVDKDQILKSAGNFFNEVRTATPNADSDPQYSRSLIGSASVLCLECEGPRNLSKQLENPAKAIAKLEQIPEDQRDDHQPAYFRQLATAFDLRYRQTRTTIDQGQTVSPKSRADLEQAIKFNTDALEHAHDSFDRAPCLVDLARQVFEIQLRTRDPDGANLRLVEKHLADAENLLRESDPTNLRPLCEQLKGNIQKYRTRQPTLDYGRTVPARRQSTLTSVASATRGAGHAQSPFLQGQTQVAEPGKM